MFLSSSTLGHFFALLALAASVHSQADPGSGGDGAPCPTQSQYFDQVIDHSLHYSNHIFKHQYRVNTTSFKEGGPSMSLVVRKSLRSLILCSFVLSVSRVDDHGVSCE